MFIFFNKSCSPYFISCLYFSVKVRCVIFKNQRILFGTDNIPVIYFIFELLHGTIFYLLMFSVIYYHNYLFPGLLREAARYSRELVSVAYSGHLDLICCTGRELTKAQLHLLCTK